MNEASRLEWVGVGSSGLPFLAKESCATRVAGSVCLGGRSDGRQVLGGIGAIEGSYGDLGKARVGRESSLYALPYTRQAFGYRRFDRAHRLICSRVRGVLAHRLNHCANVLILHAKQIDKPGVGSIYELLDSTTGIVDPGIPSLPEAALKSFLDVRDGGKRSPTLDVCGELMKCGRELSRGIVLVGVKQSYFVCMTQRQRLQGVTQARTV